MNNQLTGAKVENEGSIKLYETVFNYNLNEDLNEYINYVKCLFLGNDVAKISLELKYGFPAKKS